MRQKQGKRVVFGTVLVLLTLGDGFFTKSEAQYSIVDLARYITVDGPLNQTKSTFNQNIVNNTITAKTITDSGGGGWSSTASGMITGGQAYSELRASGTYINASTRTNANVTALDTALAFVKNEEIKASTENDALTVAKRQVTDTNGITTTTYEIQAKKATITADDTGLVSGGDAYDELRKGADGVKISSTNTTAANLTALDDQAKLNAEQIEKNEKDIQDLRDMKNLTEDGKTYIKNLAKDGIKVKSGNETIISVDKSEIGGVVNYKVSAHTGEIGEGLTTLVTGGKVYEQVHLSSDGNYVKQTNSTAQNLSALDDQVKANADLIEDLDNRVGNKIEGLFEDLSQISADAAALSALRPEGYEPDDRWSFGVGYGHYKNRNAGALGVFFKSDFDTTFSFGSTVWSGDPMLNVGASFRRKRSSGTYRTAQELNYRIRALEAMNRKRNETLATQIKRIEKAENTSFIASHRIAHLETVNQKLKEENKIRADAIAARAKEIAELQAGVKIIRANNEEIKMDNAKLKEQIDMLAVKIKEAEKAKKIAEKEKKAAEKRKKTEATTKPVAKLESTSGAKAVTKTAVKPETKVETKATVKPEIKKESAKAVAKVEMAKDVKKTAVKKEEEKGKKDVIAPISVKPLAKSVFKTQLQAVAQAELKSEAKTVVKSEAKVAKPEVKAVVKPEVKATVKPEVKKEAAPSHL